MKRAIPVDVYDKDGNMIRVEFNDTNGNHIIDAVWDPADEQTSEKREAFRKWAYEFIKNKDYEVLK
jgi:hypothetical protein